MVRTLDKSIEELSEEEIAELKESGLDELVEVAEGIEEVRSEQARDDR